MADEGMIAGLLVAIVAVAITLLWLSRRPAAPAKADGAAAGAQGEEAPEDDTVALKKGRRQRPGLQARAGRPAAAVAEGRNNDEIDEDGGLDGELPLDGIPEYDKDGKKIGAKKREKLIAKEEKRQRNEQLKLEREDEKERQRLRDEEVKKEEALKAEAEKKAQEEEKKRIEDEKKKEQEEYERLKSMFQVEDDGNVADAIAVESQGLLGEFVEYIKKQKVVLVEELASHFGLKTADAINRLQSLESMGYLTGVMDDRGKYIYISEEEMDAVCKFIRQRGRVSISELAENSNRLIRLQGETPVSA